MTPQERLDQVSSKLTQGAIPETLTVRQFLDWFGAKRRGYHVVRRIRSALKKRQLVTIPDFEFEYIDGLIRFGHLSKGPAPAVEATPEDSIKSGETPPSEPRVVAPETISRVGGAIADPTFRLGRLPSANSTPTSVKPDACLDEATTIMLTHRFSQLPVMQNERDVKGMVSWRSIGTRRSLGLECAYVRDCIEDHVEANSDQSLLAVIGVIVENDYVLVRAPNRKIQGIVTASDLSIQFRQLAEPFLLVGEIENYLRRLIDGKFSKNELHSVRKEDDSREIESVADLMFGHYLRLLSDPTKWDRVGLRVDRTAFIKRLEEVKDIRNDVMHFNPDPFAPEDLEVLRSFASFMQLLGDAGALVPSPSATGA